MNFPFSPRDTHVAAHPAVPAPRADGVAVDTVPAAIWDRLVAEFDDTHYEQTACFSASQWGERVSHLLLRRGGVAVAGARIAILTPPLFARGLAYARFAPFWRKHDRAPDVADYRAAITALVEEYCVRRGHLLTVIPRPNPDFYEQECAALAELGFAVRRAVPDPNRYLVDLSLDEDAQMKSLDQKWRYNLKQARANNLAVRLGDDADVAAFQSLHRQMVARKRFHNTDLVDMIPALNETLDPSMRPRVVLAFHEGRPVAGATVGILGDTAYYVYGATDDTALALKAGYALHWWIVGWLKGEGARWYDLGGEAQEQGLRQFKKGLTGKAGKVVVMQGEFDRWTSPAARLMGDAIYGLRAVQRRLRAWR
jgi:hypothetical protein